MAASAPDPSRFKSGSDFSASLGLTPSQHSSGGKEKLGAITKKGNRYLRKMLVAGCTSVLRVAHKYKGDLAEWIVAEWIVAMRARKPERVVAVALANKLASNRLGDHVNRRQLPPGEVHQGLKKQATEEPFYCPEFGQRNDVMKPTVAAESRGYPA